MFSKKGNDDKIALSKGTEAKGMDKNGFSRQTPG